MACPADAEQVRVSAAICLIAALAVLSGCAIVPNGDLRKLVKAAAPAGSSLECEWGSSGFEQEPKSWYGCWVHDSGGLQRVSRAVKSRLAEQGFVVSSRGDALTVQLTGLRGGRVVCVDVLAPGFSSGRNTSASEIRLSPGEILVDVWATEPREAPVGAADPPCTAMPASPDE
jgi:hypothetical protein